MPTNKFPTHLCLRAHKLLYCCQQTPEGFGCNRQDMLQRSSSSAHGGARGGARTKTAHTMWIGLAKLCLVGILSASLSRVEKPENIHYRRRLSSHGMDQRRHAIEGLEFQDCLDDINSIAPDGMLTFAQFLELLQLSPFQVKGNLLFPSFCSNKLRLVWGGIHETQWPLGL